MQETKPSPQEQLNALILLSEASQISAANIARAIETNKIDQPLKVYIACQLPTLVSVRHVRHLYRRDRVCFLIFIRILLKYLKKTRVQALQKRTRLIISQCVQHNRLDDPNFQPLMDVVEHRLRACIGEVHWSRANLYFELYCAKQSQQQCLVKMLSSHTAVTAI